MIDIVLMTMDFGLSPINCIFAIEKIVKNIFFETNFIIQPANSRIHELTNYIFAREWLVIPSIVFFLKVFIGMFFEHSWSCS